MYRLLLILICALSTTEAFAQIEKFPFIWPNSMVNWKQENLDSSQHLGIGIGNEVTFGPKFPATYFGDSTGCLIFDAFCYNPSKGFSDDYVIRKSPYRINSKDSLFLWYGAYVNFKNWTTGQMFYKPDTIEIVYSYMDSALLATDTTYPNASHMRSLGYLITTQDSIVMKRYAQSLSRLLGAGQSDTVIYLGFRKRMFTQDCAAWIDNLYMSYSGVNATNNMGSISLEIYPNPSSEGFFVRSDERISSIVLRDLTGKVVLKQSAPTDYVETSHLSTGIYTVEIRTTSGKINVRKWVKG